MGFQMISKTQALLDAMSAELGNIGAVRDEQGTGEEPAFAVPVVESWCADVGRKLLGKESSDIDRDARRIVEIVRTYPVRPYLVEGGGSGFVAPHDAAWRDEHENIVREFAALWWTAAGDAVIERYGDKLPVVPNDEYPPCIYGFHKPPARRRKK